jgi:RNA polymerase sigma-70 factor, ECF subfamily
MCCRGGISVGQNLVVRLMQTPSGGGSVKDARSLEAAYERYGATAFALARQLCSDSRQAEEVVREAFLSLWRCTRSNPAEVEALGPPLYALVHQKAAAICREEGARGGVGRPADACPPPDDGDDPAAGPAARPAGRRVLEAVDRLDPGYREALQLAYLGGLTYGEIAETLGVPEATAKRRLRDGMAGLRRLLEHPDGRPKRPRTIALDASRGIDGVWRLWSSDRM